MKIMDLIMADVKPRDIMTQKAFFNALTVDMALGCSSNSVLHLLAIANEAGVNIDLNDINRISEKTLTSVVLHPQAASISRICLQRAECPL
jgi:dihydroxy-acid dehydratase